MKRKTTEEFIQQAIAVHGQKYDYSLAEYVNDREKVEIICPIHGSFWQGAGKHLSGQGCKLCHHEKLHHLKKYDESDFIAKACAVHDYKYDYSKVKYTLSREPVEIICLVHGSFWQRPNDHISQKSGCPKCAHPRTGMNTAEFVKEAIQVHGENNYDYSQVEYKGTEQNVKIICPHHGEFWQSPYNHLNGHKCKSCADSGFDVQKPSILYLVKFQSEIASFWKIGITNRTIHERIQANEISYLMGGYQWRCKGKTAYDTEQLILKKYCHHQLSCLFPLLKNGGNTECFELSLPSERVVKEITSKIGSPPEKIKGGR